MLAGRRLAGLAEGIFVGLPALPLEDVKAVGREAENAARNGAAAPATHRHIHMRLVSHK